MAPRCSVNERKPRNHAAFCLPLRKTKRQSRLREGDVTPSGAGHLDAK